MNISEVLAALRKDRANLENAILHLQRLEDLRHQHDLGPASRGPASRDPKPPTRDRSAIRSAMR